MGYYQLNLYYLEPVILKPTLGFLVNKILKAKFSIILDDGHAITL